MTKHILYALVSAGDLSSAAFLLLLVFNNWRSMGRGWLVVIAMLWAAVIASACIVMGVR